jgi:transcriptional regulator with XRE-family HTH domain
MPRCQVYEPASVEWGRVRAILKARRQECNLSLRTFAAQLGVTQRHLCNLEQGINAPTMNTLIRWCKRLDMRFVVVPIGSNVRMFEPRQRMRRAA